MAGISCAYGGGEQNEKNDENRKRGEGTSGRQFRGFVTVKVARDGGVGSVSTADNAYNIPRDNSTARGFTVVWPRATNTRSGG